MKCMNRNKVSMYYSLHCGKEHIVDAQGFVTGEQRVKRSKPVLFRANVSPQRGETIIELFGEELLYDRVILVDDVHTPIDEYTVLWVDKAPKLDTNGELLKDVNGEVVTPHDYVVKKVAKSLNHVSIAISKVDVNG